jgi:hypothetical protein
MLRRVRDFENYVLRARDGDIGRTKEFLFDDKNWAIRYLVAETGIWLSSRKILVSPHALNPAIGYDDVIPVNLTKKQIEDSPSLESDMPVSRQYEEEYHNFYMWPYYGSGGSLWGSSPYLWGQMPANQENRDDVIRNQRMEDSWDPCLRSTHDVTGHHVQASDGEIGHVVDFIIDEDNWSIRYLIVDTKNWWPGKHVLISPEWIDRVSWDDHKIFVKVTREAVRQSPEYSASTLNRDYEDKLHIHYNAHGYWLDQPEMKPVGAGSQVHVEGSK